MPRKQRGQTWQQNFNKVENNKLLVDNDKARNKAKAKGKKGKKKKGRKLVIALSERDSRILFAEAQRRGVRCNIAARQLLHVQLQQCTHELESSVADNQLNLFDAVQIDIFNNTSKAKRSNAKGE